MGVFFFGKGVAIHGGITPSRIDVQQFHATMKSMIIWHENLQRPWDSTALIKT
jgi:hypothetical protein